MSQRIDVGEDIKVDNEIVPDQLADEEYTNLDDKDGSLKQSQLFKTQPLSGLLSSAKEMK